MPLAAVLGWPLSHTLSPALHNAAYEAAGRHDWRYEARPTSPDRLAGQLAELRDGRLAGVNLTTPHKLAVVALIDELEGAAGPLAAVNTVVARDGVLRGSNTDVPGALWALGEQLELSGASWDGHGPALLLGTGGVAAAVAMAWALLTEERARSGRPTAPLVVAGRDQERAEATAAHAGPGASTVRFDAVVPLVRRAGVLIQATTLTARGEPVPGQHEIASGARVLDCNYGPEVGQFVRAAKGAGAAAVADGLGMLVAQAAAAVVRMAGLEPDLAAMAAGVGRSWPLPVN